MHLTLAKLRRCARKVPSAAVARFIEPIFNSGQVLTAIVAIIGLILVTRHGTAVERQVQVSQWTQAVEVFGMALVGWAALSLLSAPFIVIRADRLLGRWYGRVFVYREPHLVATIRCRSGNEDQQHTFKFDDPEAGSMVYCTVVMHPPPVAVTAQVYGLVRTGNPPPPGSWSSFRIELDREGHVSIFSQRRRER